MAEQDLDNTQKRSVIYEPSITVQAHKAAPKGAPSEDPQEAPPFVPTFTFNERSTLWSATPNIPSMSNSRVDCPPVGGKWTFSLWYKMPALGGTQFERPAAFVSLNTNKTGDRVDGDGNKNSLRWLVDSFERLSLVVRDSNGDIVKQYIGDPVSTSVWHHHVYTFDGPSTGTDPEVDDGSHKGYIDGAFFTDASFFASSQNFINEPGTTGTEFFEGVELGTVAPDGGPSLDTVGPVYRVALWNKVLSAAEILELFNARSDPDKHYYDNFGNYTSAGNLRHYYSHRVVEDRFRDEGNQSEARLNVDNGNGAGGGITSSFDPVFDADVPV